jgi:hypothetical protein
MIRRAIAWALPFLTCLATVLASDAGEQAARLDWFGDISEEPAYFLLRRDTPINPRSEILTFPEWQNRISGDFNATLAFPPLKLVTKVRPTIESQPAETEVSFPVDDLYLDLNLFQRAFATVGVKNYREGVGLSFNPTDFLAETKEQDFTKREDERRADREGNLVVAVDVFFKNVTLTAIAAPRVPGLQDDETRALFKVSVLFEAAKLDASVLYFLAHRPGVGLNLSKTIGEALELHAEAAGRGGSPRRQVRKIQEPIGAVRPAVFEIRNPPDRDKIFTELVAGGTYTFSDGTNLTGEYYFIQDGYPDRQWDRVLELIEVSRAQFLEGRFQDLARGNLLRANELLTFRRLRQHYVFFRIQNARWLEYFDASLAFLLNTQDRSFAVAPIIDFTGIRNFRLGINATILQGRKDSEFGMAPFGARLSFLFRYLF